MLRNVLQALWGEPRPDRPPVRVWRDWALLGVLLAWSVLEALFREGLSGSEASLPSAFSIPLVWRPVAVVVTVAVLLTLLWRRTHPFATVVAAFGILTAFDVVRILATIENGLLWSIAGVLVLPYSLFRWGSGREAGTGLGVILAWLVVTHIADPTPAGEVVAGFGFFLFSAALGASIRFHANARARDIEQAKLRQRHQLARELHDVMGHYVSAIAIQAQAGRAMVGSEPARAATALKTIEETASHALKEMRVMVGVLREGGEPDLAPQAGVGDIARLARQTDGRPMVAVQLSDDVDQLRPAVGAALYRIAQESVTNAIRHARNATRITVDVVIEGEEVRLLVRDDGEPAAQGPFGYGLVGIAERARLLGGSFRAGPAAGGGWMVDVVLPARA